MADQTKIEWANSTFNPWTGCTKVSPGCDHCYAEGWAKRSGTVQWGPGAQRRRTTSANWRKPLQWNAARFMQCGACGWRGECSAELIGCGACGSIDHLNDVRRRVFCASLADVFDNQVQPVWRADLFKLIADTPNLDWLLLTKRIGNVANMIPFGWQDFGMPANVWLGATVVNQEEADRDIPKLLTTPAAVRFLSIEPMLGPIDLTGIPVSGSGHSEFDPIVTANVLQRVMAYPPLPQIDWVICGGESGPGARPMEIAWARSLAQQCKAAGVAFHMKQLGAQPRGWCAAQVHADPADREDAACDFYEAHECGAPCPGRCAAMVDKKGGDMAEWPEDLRIREFPHAA